MHVRDGYAIEIRCDGCGALLQRLESMLLRRPRGRPPRWCSDRCRMRARRAARAGGAA